MPTNMTTKTVLFDFDGTLADTLPLSFKAFKAVFEKYDNRIVTEEQLVGMFGPTEDEIIATNLENISEIKQAIQDYYDIYKQGHFDELQQNYEIIDMLRLLKQHEIKIGVITGKSKKAFIISSEALQLSGFFDLAITGDDVECPKPHPEGIFKALDFFETDKNEAVFLGDSNADIKAGKAAGIRTFGVQWLSTYQSSHFEVPPDLIFTNIQQFIRQILEDKSSCTDI
ncbi:HAD family hydrolase [Cohnella faecalis]|uniref:HAD family hydrolase n=1 Tax=Cohnella faecalis TaxID=2315694 RepID=A0A398CNR0_9BACL|nr:HAD family hydrolase [Cohnella faecalis]RIE01211.1 HAD family hydrolase [Cohnella faecalis]